MRTVKIIDSLQLFLKAEPYWDALVRESGPLDVPFLTFDWLKSWWETCAGPGRMSVAVISQDGIPVCALPLMARTVSWRGIPCRGLCCISVEQGGRSGLIGSASGTQDAVALVLRHLAGTKARFDMLLLDGLPEGSPASLQLDAFLPGSGFGFRRLEGLRSPYIPIATGWEEYLKGRSRNAREKIRRTAKSIEKEGRCILRYVRETGRVGEAMDAVVRISERTWKFRERTAIASDPRTARFYRRYAEHAAKGNMLKLMLLEYGGTPIAFTYELEYRGTDYFVKTGFDSGYSRLSPGIFILASSIRDAFRGGCREYDLLGSDEDYKMQFTDLIRPHFKYRVFNRNTLGMILHSVERSVPVLKRLARGIHVSPVEVTRRKASR